MANQKEKGEPLISPLRNLGRDVACNVWAGLVTSGYNRKDSSETRPYRDTIYCENSE
ncbi:hypothetical protein MC7420_3070 [Coleofasciculus chthonoplastes PCC 7420]|uniref:Uncharacterized protein n=1 Tax=Coleofasciculus chthonoplastes PCC 7420 TaxID=118168 RepID=B4VKJ2_9CYAN|nr:hypothetical protein MC7420_3070 [Coleofasciculus chthonoplastes PCC 7420]